MTNNQVNRQKKINAGIILARGGSKGIPKKNIINFCGKPLIAWTIENCLNSKNLHKLWVSSDSDEILSVAQSYGSDIIKRPKNLSSDHASSEYGWLHALDQIESQGYNVLTIVAPQVTSPLRSKNDIDKGIRYFKKMKYDSMFSSSAVKDLFMWDKRKNGKLESMNYDYKNRKIRQNIKKKQIENGSFYIFKPEILRTHKNRLGGKIGFYEMELWKFFEIDNLDDLKTCSVLMGSYLSSL